MIYFSASSAPSAVKNRKKFGKSDRHGRKGRNGEDDPFRPHHPLSSKKGPGPILAVDADPSSNLADALGLPVKQSLGTAREDFFETKGKLPPGMTKETYLEMKLHEILVESKGLDLLVMGRPEGPGCYCYANNILRRHLDLLVKNYPFVVMDNEAGMEHLSRRTTQGVDYLLFLSDYSHQGDSDGGEDPGADR